MNPEPVFFSHNIESLFIRRLQPTLTPALIEKLKAIGLDLSAPLLPAYNYRVWEKALALVVDSRADLSREAAYSWLGAENVNGAMGTTMGQATLQLAKLIGLRRVFKRLPHTQRNYSNFYALECEAVQGGVKLRFFLDPQFTSRVGPREDPLVVHFNSGTYLRLVELMGGRDGRSEVLSHDPVHRRTEYLVTWQD